jgi:carbon monoxide dehydrogenase subunit G
VNTIEIQYDIARKPDDVFAFLTDFSQLTKWRTLEDFRVEPNDPIHLGSRLFSKVSGIGRPMQFTNEVVELDPTRRVYRDRCLDGTFLIQSGWQVEANNGGSRLKWATEFAAPGLMKLLTPVLRRAIRQGQLQDLMKLKQILERS